MANFCFEQHSHTGQTETKGSSELWHDEKWQTLFPSLFAEIFPPNNQAFFTQSATVKGKVGWVGEGRGTRPLNQPEARKEKQYGN